MILARTDHVLHKRGQLEVFVPGFGWKLLSEVKSNRR